MTSTNDKHYLDYYSDWLLELKKANCFHDMKAVTVRASAFIGIINELWDADRIAIQLASSYITEVNEETNRKLNTFLN